MKNEKNENGDEDEERVESSENRPPTNNDYVQGISSV